MRLPALSLETSDTAPAPAACAAPVLLLAQSFPPAVGGSAVLFENIYGRLEGVDLYVLTDVANGGAVDLDARWQIVRRPFGAPRWGLRDPRGLRQHVRLAWNVRSVCGPRHAIVHCGRALPEGFSTQLAGLLRRTPYVCWTHGEELVSVKTSREYTWITRSVHRHAGAVFANSRNTARQLESAWGVPARKIHVVYPGVDTRRFRPSVDGRAVRARFAPLDETLLLSVGRLERRKGHDVCIAAVAAARRTLPQLRYLIVGDGPERPQLEALIRQHGLSGVVSLVGEVPDADLPRYYAAADIFLLPNRVDRGEFEGFGIVFLEAAASGVVAIGGASGGVPEAVADGETGLLVSGTDPDEVAAAIRVLAAAPELRRKMGAAARERAQRDFTWDRAAATVGAVHRALAAASEGRRAD